MRTVARWMKAPSPGRSLPYGASKLAAEVVARQAFDGFGVPVVIARSFNHIGAGSPMRSW